MKHGFVQEMENIIDSDTKITHVALSLKVFISTQLEKLESTRYILS